MKRFNIVACITRFMRRQMISFELRNNEYHLAHISSMRHNDYQVERLLHKRQIQLQEELRRLERHDVQTPALRKREAS